MKRRQTFPDGTPGTASDEDEPRSPNDSHHDAPDRLAKDDTRLRQLFDGKVLPSMMMLALIFGIATTTFSYAVAFRRDEDLDLNGTQSGWLFSAPHVLQIPLQFPVAWVLSDSFPLDKLASMAFCMLAALFNMTAASGTTWLMVCRLLQGVLEASILPPLVSMTHVYWSREEVPLRMSCWFSMTGLATIVMSIFTYFLVSSSYQGPHSVLILACAVIILSIYTICMVVFSGASTMELKFLSDRDKKIAYGLQRLSVPRSHDWSQEHVRQAKKDAKTWLWFGLIFAASVPIGGINCSSLLILKSPGVGSSRILFNVPFGAVQIMAIMGGGLAATKYRIGCVIVGLCLISVAGFISLAGAVHTPGATSQSVLAGYYLTAATYGVVPLIYSWSGVNTAGATKQKATAAFMFIGQSLGNIFGSLLFQPSSGEIVGSRGLWASLMVLLLMIGLVVVTSVHIGNLNPDHTCRYDTKDTKAEVILHANARLDSALDINLMQSEGGAYMLSNEGFGLPYLFRPEIYEDLTDVENDGFFFTL